MNLSGTCAGRVACARLRNSCMTYFAHSPSSLFVIVRIGMELCAVGLRQQRDRRCYHAAWCTGKRGSLSLVCPLHDVYRRHSVPVFSQVMEVGEKRSR